MGISSFFLGLIEAAPTAPVLLLGVMVAIVSLRSQRHLTRAKHTLDFDKEFKEKHKSSLINARDAFGQLTWEQLGELGKTGKLTANSADQFTAVVNALNVWEGVAIALKNEVYDERLLFDAYATSVVWLYKNSIPFVKARQEDNSRLFSNFVSLGVRWSAKTCLPARLEKEMQAKEQAEKEIQDALELRKTAEIKAEGVREYLSAKTCRDVPSA